ncbi:MAG: zinc ribbon-containing protein [Methanobacteriaceae archaeon]|jgi:predicted  nucleic acid-binding Zn-ribbon protein|nr:zinc ribbon-containing protein [Candidatus Methanorudis spinitermitis]
MYISGDHSGKGRYLCTKCSKALYLEDSFDILPLCPECGNQQFLVG